MDAAATKKAGEPYPAEETAVLEKVHEILSLLARSVSSIKIFSLNHSTSQRLTEALWQDTNRFLEKHSRLEVGVKEFAFLYRDKVVYREEKAIKSLPFLLFKDGTKKLLIDKGLRREELMEFLILLKEAFETKQEDLDLVHLLWEKDYPHIRCFAPDSFLETKIGLDQVVQTPRVDAAGLQSGSVELTSEDRSSLIHSLDDGSAFRDDSQSPLDLESSLASGDGGARLSQEEDFILKQMLHLNRKLSPEMEMVFLISEILYLEARPKQFSEALGVMDRIHKEIIKKGRFDCAAQLLNNTFEAAARLSLEFSSPGAMISQFLDKVRSMESFSLVKASVLEHRPQDFTDFFDYIKLLGPEAMLILGEVYDQIKSPSYTTALNQYLKERAGDDPPSLLRLAVPSRPSLTRLIIGILGNQPGQRAVPILGYFKSGWQKSFRLEAIRALGRGTDDVRSRVLADYLADEDEEVRIAAAQNMRSLQDPALQAAVKDILSAPDLYKKSQAEKLALTALMARARTPDSHELLEDLLRHKSGLRHRGKKTALRLAVVNALVGMGTPEARSILERGSRLANRKVRRAAREALQKFYRR